MLPTRWISLTAVLCLMPILADAWINDWDDPVHFQCPSGQSMSRINSEHNNDKEDRRWNLYCSRVPVPGSLSNCRWTGDVNVWDAPVHYECPGDGFVTGMGSYHDNDKEDRRFKFQCCEVQAAMTHSCYFTGWQNQWDGVLDYSVPHRMVLRGVESYHDDHKEDRRFRFEVCNLDLLNA